MKASSPTFKWTCPNMYSLNEYRLYYGILLALCVVVAEGLWLWMSASSVPTTLLWQISLVKSVLSHLEQNLVEEVEWPNLQMPFPFRKKVLADTDQRQSQGEILNTLWAMIMSMEQVYRIRRGEKSFRFMNSSVLVWKTSLIWNQSIRSQVQITNESDKFSPLKWTFFSGQTWVQAPKLVPLQPLITSRAPPEPFLALFWVSLMLSKWGRKCNSELTKLRRTDF